MVNVVIVNVVMTVLRDYLFQANIITRNLLFFGLAILLASCSVAPPAPKVLDPEPPRPIQPEKNLRVLELLTQAETAFANKRLTTPLDDNAYFRYLQVLSIEPNNPLAQTGIERIVETYLVWSIEAITNRQYRRATNMLNKARSIDPEHPDMNALAARIERAQNSARTLYKLDQAELTEKSPALVARLHEIGRIVERLNGKVIITARNDRQGRWIYQQLNQASIARVRATVQIGTPPSVQLTHP